MTTPISQRIIIILFALILSRAAWESFTAITAPGFVLVGCTLGGCGLALFAWAYRQHRGLLPGKAFTREAPPILVISGPYRWVRHPIYTAYLISILGLAVGTVDAVLTVAWGLMAVLYFQAALLEERLILTSPNGDNYRVYMQHTGRLLPWNFHRKPRA